MKPFLLLIATRFSLGRRIKTCRNLTCHPIDGYIIIKSSQKAKRWMILDWFADRNNEKVLETLLSTTCVFLKKNTPAMMLEVCGFPTWIQPLLKQYLPHARQVGHNVFSWGSSNKEFRKAIMPIIDSRKSWFFGPYDGDECLS